jgi:protein-L-isoaspartate O-methyltransferase
MTNALLFPAQTQPKPQAILAAGRALHPALLRGSTLDARQVKTAMDFAFNGSDTSGAWIWKDAYDACEVATVMSLKKLQHQFARLEERPHVLVDQLVSLTKLSLTHSRRSEEQTRLDQFSTPAPIAALAVLAAQVRPTDKVLEPSAGTGLIAVLAEACGASLVLNELAETRNAVLKSLFPAASLTKVDGKHAADLIKESGSIDAVIMNPPFQGIEDHISSAFRALADGGRLVAIVPSHFLESKAVLKLNMTGKVQAMMIFPERVFYKHGTTVETGLIVVDRISPPDGLAPIRVPYSLAEAIDMIAAIPERASAKPRAFLQAAGVPIRAAQHAMRSTKFGFLNGAAPMAYSVVDWSGHTKDVGLYSEYQLSRIRFERSAPHPSPLVESSSMATTPPPAPSHIPMLPIAVQDKLSDAQKEMIVYAGQAHSQFLPGWWKLDDKGTMVINCRNEEPGTFRVRRGFFCGDGTGVGKGRIGFGIIAAYMASIEPGKPRKALFLSKNDSLYQDALRDHTGLGGLESDIVLQSAYKLGSTIRMDHGIVFTTYATLRTGARNGKASRLDQLVQWLGADWDGVIILDEAHELANAMAGEGERGVVKASQQGLAGLLLQYRLPNARVVYQSATGATTPQNLAYACRLGLWGSPEAPFMTRENFMEAADAGGHAVLELISRELKALGLYNARTLSFEGVEVAPLKHDLTDEDREIWAAYSDAFHIIHKNLDAALEATGITSEGETQAKNAKSAAKSAFQSTSQRFFNALLSSLKIPTIIRHIQQNVDAGNACVIQVVATNESVLNRRLDAIDPSDWNDLHIDLSPKDAIVEYLQHAFPVTLLETYTDDDGKEITRAVTDENGRPVVSQEALALRDELLMKLAILPSIPGVLDALIHHFGDDKVAEITGRSRRILLRDGRQVLERRSKSAVLADANAFANDEKQILIFSDAGGTGKSYHADRNYVNQRQRVHLLAEPGWKATSALQGLGRTHRSNAVSAPVFCPVTTDIKGEKRFLSTISRRLASLGALTRGERRTGGNGLFRAEDDLENAYARRALVSFLTAMANNQVTGIDLRDFEEMTALNLFDKDGNVLEVGQLPSMPKFLNRLLALKIPDQNLLFEAFEERLTGILERARETGQLDVGVSDLVYENLELVEDRVIRVDPTGAETKLMRFNTRQLRKMNRIDDLQWLLDSIALGSAQRVINRKSKRVGLAHLGQTICDDKDNLVRAVRLYRPESQNLILQADYEESAWEPCDEAQWTMLWDAEIAHLDPYITKTVNLVTGLLLPVWKHMGREGYVWRLIAPNGDRLLGRILDDVDAQRLCVNLGITSADDGLKDPAKVEEIVVGRDGSIELAHKLYLKRSRVMHDWRIEITGNDREYRTLKALGCIVEIINSTTRLFIPIGKPDVMSAILQQYPPHRLVA